MMSTHRHQFSLEYLLILWYLIGETSGRESGLAEDYSANQIKCRLLNRKWENEMSFPYRLAIASLLDLMTHIGGNGQISL